jgi:NAD+ synthase
MRIQSAFSSEVLELDREYTLPILYTAIRDIVFHRLHKRGVVVGLSGGIDSSVTAALCVGALGKERVFGLMMPEVDSASESTGLGALVADFLGIDAAVEDITPMLKAAKCYNRRDECIRQVIPEYGPNWKSKIVLPNVLESESYSVYSVIATTPEGEEVRARLTAEAYLGIVAATNFKQRTRKMLEYYHGDRLQYAVAGTPNRLEYDLGFFVKLGDGAADFKPIAHLYKSQVYQLAEYLGIPEEIRRRPPTTDTYSMPQSQEEFYFSLSLAKMDLCLYGRDHEVSAEDVGRAIGLNPDQVTRIFRQIDGKRKASRYLHARPVLVEDVSSESDSISGR